MAELLKPGTLPDQMLGKADAPVTIVEYASMTCPHCAHFHATTLPELKKKYIDTGKARLIFREFPFDPRAEAGFMLARCSKDKYFPMIDVLFKQQANWASVENAKDALLQISKLAGFSQEFLRGLLDGPETSGRCESGPEARIRRVQGGLDADLFHQRKNLQRGTDDCGNVGDHRRHALTLLQRLGGGRASARPRDRADEVFPAPPSRFQILRRTRRVRDRTRPYRHRRAKRLRQVQSRRGAALGDGRKLVQEHARVRHGRRDIFGLRHAAGSQHRRSHALSRQQRPHRARRVQRRRRIAGVAPYRARGGFDLPHQRQGGARQGRAIAVRRPVDRRALALDGRAGPHRRTDPGQAPGSPRAARGGGGHFRSAHQTA